MRIGRNIIEKIFKKSNVDKKKHFIKLLENNWYSYEEVNEILIRKDYEKIRNIIAHIISKDIPYSLKIKDLKSVFNFLSLEDINHLINLKLRPEEKLFYFLWIEKLDSELKKYFIDNIWEIYTVFENILKFDYKIVDDFINKVYDLWEINELINQKINKIYDLNLMRSNILSNEWINFDMKYKLLYNYTKENNVSKEVLNIFFWTTDLSIFLFLIYDVEDIKDDILFLFKMKNYKISDKTTLVDIVDNYIKKYIECINYNINDELVYWWILYRLLSELYELEKKWIEIEKYFNMFTDKIFDKDKLIETINAIAYNLNNVSLGNIYDVYFRILKYKNKDKLLDILKENKIYIHTKLRFNIVNKLKYKHSDIVNVLS